MVNLRELWKKDWVKTLVILVVIVVIIVGFWFGLKAGLRTEYPLLAVATGSMRPTLNVGDLILVQGVSNISEIHAAPMDDPEKPGDIIVYWKTTPKAERELIVHRAIRTEFRGDRWYIITKGDNNTSEDRPPVPFDDVVGKVVGQIPWLGYVSLFLRTTEGTVLIVLVIVVILASEFVFPYLWKEPQREEEETQKPQENSEETRLE